MFRRMSEGAAAIGVGGSGRLQLAEALCHMPDSSSMSVRCLRRRTSAAAL
jgi:hypothetical protein